MIRSNFLHSERSLLFEILCLLNSYPVKEEITQIYSSLRNFRNFHISEPSQLSEVIDMFSLGAGNERMEALFSLDHREIVLDPTTNHALSLSAIDLRTTDTNFVQPLLIFFV